MKRWLERLLLSGLALLCWQCFASLGGGSSEAEGFTLAGRVLDSAGSPLSGAKVELFAERPWGQGDSTTQALDSARTQGDGRFAFRRLAKGRYALLATADHARLAGFRSAVAIAGDDTLKALALTRAATLSGKLPVEFPYSRVKYVALPGTPYRSPVTALGDFSLTGIVPGTYGLALVLRSNFHPDDPVVIGDLDTVRLEPAQSLVIDSLRVPTLEGSGPFLVNDFAACELRNNLGGIWWSTNDRGSGGSSRVTSFQAADPGDGSGGCAARFAFTFAYTAPYPFVGIGTYLLPLLDTLPRAIDLENATGISFRAKGRGAALEVLLQSSVSGLVSGQGFDIAQVPAAWTTYTVDFRKDMKDTYDSTDIRSWQQRRKAFTHFQFDAIPIAGADSGEVWIDDIRILLP